MKEVEELLKRELLNIMISPEDLRRRMFESATSDDKKFLEEKLDILKEKLIELERKRKRLIDQFASGLFTPAETRDYRKTLDTVEAQINEEIEEVNQKLGLFGRTLTYREFIKRVRKAVKREMLSLEKEWTDEEKMDMAEDYFREYISKVVIYPDRIKLKFNIPIDDKQLLLKPPRQQVVDLVTIPSFSHTIQLSNYPNSYLFSVNSGNPNLCSA